MFRTRLRRVVAAVVALPIVLTTVATMSPTPVGAAAGEPSAEMAVTVAGVPIRDDSTVDDGTTVSVGVSGLLTPGTGQRELRATLDPGMQYTAGSAEAPEGWNIEFSTDDGANWVGTEPTPASGVTDVRASASVTAGAITGYSQLYSSETVAPVPSSTFSGSTGGDGWDVFFYDDFVFNIFHHNGGAIVLDCHLRSTGARCAGGYTATFNGYQTANRSGGWVDSITGKLYAFTTQSSTGRPGVLCVDVNSAPTSCGFTPLSTDTTVTDYSYLTNAEFVGRRIFGVETSGTGSLLCFDAALGTQCPNSPIDLVGATDSNQTYPLSFGDKIMVKTASQMYCYDANTLAACAGTWPATISAANSTPAAPHTDANGALDGVCHQNGCLDLTGATTAWTSPWSLGSGSFAWPVDSGFFSGALTQGRFYFVSTNELRVDCFDYATDARCANFPTAAFAWNFYGIYATRVDPNNPSCIWINSDGGQIRVFDAFTGQPGCSANPVITLQPSSFAPRFTCTTPNSIDEWRVLELTSVAGAGTPGTISLTVRDALGATVAGWVNRPIVIGEPLDMTGLDVTLSGSRPTFNFAFGNITGGSITNATIALDYAGKGPELCIDATLQAGSAVCPVLTGLDGALIDSVPAPAQTFTVRREFTIGTDVNLCPEDIRPMTVPSVPRDLNGSAGPSGGSIFFKAPADDGGSPLREYKLSIDGGTTWTTPTVIDNGDGTFTVNLSGLTPGTTYPLELRATNLMGRSVGATLSLVVSSTPPTTTPPPAPEIEVEIPLDPGTPADGAPIELGGQDLKPNSVVEVKLYPGGVVVGTATTGPDGTFVLNITLPEGMTPGGHELRLEGTGPDDQPFTSSQELFVDWSGSIADATPSTGGYHPLAPVRVLDTRVAPGTKVAARTEQRVTFPADLLPADVTAVAFNLTVTEPEKAGFLTAHVCGADRPAASSLNFSAGETTANLVEAVIRDGQDLCVFSMVEAHVVVDVAGYHSESATELLTAREPKRLVDTRLTQRVAAGETLVVPVIGDGLAPAGTLAAYLDLAVTTPEGSGFLTVFPCGTERPWASTLNYADGDLASNSAIAKIGADGTVCVYTMRTTDIVVDLTGTFSASGTGRFAGFVSGRMADTRIATELQQFQTLELTVVGDGATPAGTTAVALNIGVDAPERAGFLTVWPCGTARPWSSALDFKAGETVSNHVTATPGADGKVCIYSMATTDVVVDIEGIYWAAPVT